MFTPKKVLLLAGLLAAAGCGKAAVTEPAPDPAQVRKLDAAILPAVNEVVTAGNRFAFDLYGRLRSRPGNLFCSPQNISTAFAMTFAGAAGGTRDEMAAVFHFPASQDSFHAAFGAVLASLDRGTALGGYQLSLANRLWGQRGMGFLPAFLDITRRHYGAQLQTLDFVGHASTSRDTINAWVASKTGGRIPDLMPPNSVNRDTRLVLTSAIYFKGLWENRFDPKYTLVNPFHVAPGVDRSVPTMHATLDCRTGYAAGVQLLELPYRGGDLSMVILLPDSLYGLGALEQRLDADTLGAWLATLGDDRLPVALPRFKITTSLSLVETLTEMGMPSAFQPFQADFSGMDGARDLFIAAAVHKAYVDVNEEGTEAAAATGVSMGATSVPARQFVANHPFVFVLRDNITGSLLFVGRVSDPSS